MVVPSINPKIISDVLKGIPAQFLEMTKASAVGKIGRTMPLFYNEKTILYLKSSSLDLYNEKNIEGERLEIPQDSLDNLEVTNAEKLKALLGEFFAKFELGGKTGILVLSDEVILQQELPPSETEQNSQKPEEEKDKTAVSREGQKPNGLFEDPADSGKLTKRKLQLEGKSLLVATNRELLMIIVKQLDKIGFRFESIVPAPLFGIDSKQQTLLIADIKHLVKDRDRLRRANLLDGLDDALSKTGAPSGSILTRQFSEWLFAPVLVGCLVILLAIYWFKFGNPEDLHSLLGMRSSVVPRAVATPAVSPWVTAQPSSSASVLPVSTKRNLRFEVLNGTGVSGLAKRESDKLTALGYSLIDIGNAPGPNANQTTITVDDKVTPDEKDEVVTLMKKDFDPVVVKPATSKSNYNLIIVTGPQSR